MREQRVEERLACKLDDEELLEAGQRLAACHTRLEEHAGEVAAARKKSKDAAARLEAERNELVDQLVKGVAWRYVTTIERFDVDSATVRVVRLDTQETVRERDMTQAECRAHQQTELDLERGERGVEGLDEPTCRVCFCTEADQDLCLSRTGEACQWVEADLCSACVIDIESPSRLRREIHRWPAVDGLEGEDNKEKALELVSLLEAALEADGFGRRQVLELRDRRRDLVIVAGELVAPFHATGLPTPQGTIVEVCDLVRRFLGLAAADEGVAADLLSELEDDLKPPAPFAGLPARPRLEVVLELLEDAVRDVDEVVGGVHVPVEGLVVAFDAAVDGPDDVTVAFRRYGKRPEPTKRQVRAVEALLADVEGVVVTVEGASTHREILKSEPPDGVQVVELEIDRLRVEGSVRAVGLVVGTVEGYVGAVRAIPVLNGSDLNGPVGESFDQVAVERLGDGLVAVKVGQKDRPLTDLERAAIGWSVNCVRSNADDFRFIDFGAGATLTPGNGLRSVGGDDLGEPLTAELLEAFGGKRLVAPEDSDGAATVTCDELRTWLADRFAAATIDHVLIDSLVVERDIEDVNRVSVRIPEAGLEDLVRIHKGLE